MKKTSQIVLGFALFYIISTPVMALDPETRAIKRQLMSLHNEFKLSAANLSLLLQHTELTAILSKSDNITVFAALESMKGAKGDAQDNVITITEESRNSARTKIESYNKLCLSVKEHESIHSDYCKFMPYANLYTEYMDMQK